MRVPSFQIPDSILQSAVDDGVFTHAVYALAVEGVIAAQKPFGAASTETVFDLASLTKPMSTATLLLQCVERGELHLRQKLNHFFPPSPERGTSHSDVPFPSGRGGEGRAGVGPERGTSDSDAPFPSGRGGEGRAGVGPERGTSDSDVPFPSGRGGEGRAGVGPERGTSDSDAPFPSGRGGEGRAGVGPERGTSGGAGAEGLADIDLFHLATHTSGLPPIPDWPADPASHSREALIRFVLDTASGHDPGAAYAYSDTGYILLGEIVSIAAGIPLPELFRTRIAEPAGLRDTAFLPPADWLGRIAPTSPLIAAGIVHDPRARDLGGVAGHAGLFGTAGDVLAYLEIVRKGGAPLLSKASVARMSASQIDPVVGAHSIGWFCNGNDYLPSGDLFSRRAFGHSGFTGTVALIDPEYRVSVVLLTNRVISEDEDNRRFLAVRRRWLNAVAAVVTA